MTGSTEWSSFIDVFDSTNFTWIYAYDIPDGTQEYSLKTFLKPFILMKEACEQQTPIIAIFK